MVPRIVRDSLNVHAVLLGLILLVISVAVGCQPGPQGQVGTLGQGIDVDPEELDARRE